jgi:AraC-like DNA-binding protein
MSSQQASAVEIATRFITAPIRGVNTRLSQVHNWGKLAREAEWSVKQMAKLCGVSARTLEKQFLRSLGKKPKTWLTEERQRDALRLLQEGESVKGTAAILGYKHATHFTRQFKKHWSCLPSSAANLTGLGVHKLS